MKRIIGAFLYSFIGLYVSIYTLNGIIFEKDTTIGILLLVIALAILNILSKPIIALFSMPEDGIGHLILSFVLNLAVLFLFANFGGFMTFQDGVLPNLSIIGYNLGDISFGPVLSIVYTSLLISVVVILFEWLAHRKKR